LCGCASRRVSFVLFTALLLRVCAGFGVLVFLVSIAVLSYAVLILTV